MVMPEEERRNTAYHESGHAMIGKLLPKCDPVHKVTIIPRGRALGVTMSLPAQDRYSYDSEYMLNTDRHAVRRPHRRRSVHEPDDHRRSNDFERATQLARDMVMRYGMTEALGPMVYAENEGEVFLGRSVTKTTNMREATMQKVDAEVRRIIDEQYALARKLIEDNQDKMHAMAKALLEWETIDAEQLDDIMAGKEPRPPKDCTPRTPPRAAAAPAVSRRDRSGAYRRLTSAAPRDRQRGPAGPLSWRCRLTGPCIGMPMHWQTSRFLIDLTRPRVMGIVNVTPDSFSDGGRYASTRRGARALRAAAGEGADILDIGGESTRPGTPPVPLEEELARVLPVLREARDAGRPGLRRHLQARGDARGARPRRRHHQRHLGAAARPARSRPSPRIRTAACA